jgi:hypothetical protein
MTTPCTCSGVGGVYGHEPMCGQENPDAAQDAWEQAQRDNERAPWYTRVDDADIDFGTPDWAARPEE